MDDKKYMQLALAEARKAAELDEIPIGAVLADMTTARLSPLRTICVKRGMTQRRTLRSSSSARPASAWGVGV